MTGPLKFPDAANDACRMMGTQLGRMLLATPVTDPAPADGQVARVDERGSYGELIEAIDRLIDDVAKPPDAGPVAA